MSYKFLSHVADLKIECKSRSIEGIFNDAAIALGDYMHGRKVDGSGIKKIVKVSGKDDEQRLYKFLDEIICLAEKGFVCSDAETKIVGNRVIAKLGGRMVKDLKQVKAATYGGMSIDHQKIWIAKFVVDI